jgi:hypothetical protein
MTRTHVEWNLACTQYLAGRFWTVSLTGTPFEVRAHFRDVDQVYQACAAEDQEFGSVAGLSAQALLSKSFISMRTSKLIAM